MTHAIANLLRDERGATLVEYGLLLLLIAMAAVAVLGTIGGQVSAMYTNMGNDF
ncbi:MAG TPA: Flp family type IVb pilin [Candidatus Tyrphobacter sp.]